jgi:hypothetical protein
MEKLSCKLKGLCGKQGSQTLEGCYGCSSLKIDKELAGWASTMTTNKNVEQLTQLAQDKLAAIKDPTKAARFNEGKPQWSLVHFKSLEPMVRVLEFGCIKYDRNNWKKAMDTSKILESMQRHLAALFDGEEVDSETGISHMGHIQCNAMFYNYHKDKENDDDRLTE